MTNKHHLLVLVLVTASAGCITENSISTHYRLENLSASTIEVVFKTSEDTDETSPVILAPDEGVELARTHNEPHMPTADEVFPELKIALVDGDSVVALTIGAGPEAVDPARWICSGDDYNVSSCTLTITDQDTE